MIHFLPVEWHDSLPSTNTFLMERVRMAPDTPHGTVVAARSQTAGRGRQQRAWVAVPNENITVSFLWNAPLPAAIAPSMAQAISLGICQAIQSHVCPTIKWPNDVLVNGRKISGILCEAVGVNINGNTAIVAGIGLNVNMGHEGAEAIDQPATSLFLERGHAFDPVEVLDNLLDGLALALGVWSGLGYSGIREAYARFGPPIGTRLSVRDGVKHRRGTLTGYNEHGALLLRAESGEEMVFYSGDIGVDG